MKPVKVIGEETFEMRPDVFYHMIGNLIDESNPRSHMFTMSHDPLHRGLMLYPVRVYETIRKLKEQQNGTSGDR